MTRPESQLGNAARSSGPHAVSLAFRGLGHHRATVRFARFTAMFGSPTPTKQTCRPASSRAAATIIISDLLRLAASVIARTVAAAATATATNRC